MEVGDGFNPEIGGESVVVDVEFAVLVADGGDEAGADIVCNGGIERCHRAENVRGTVRCALRADALDDVGERRIDIVGALAFDVVQLANHRTRTGVDWENRVGRVRSSRALPHLVKTNHLFSQLLQQFFLLLHYLPARTRVHISQYIAYSYDHKAYNREYQNQTFLKNSLTILRQSS